MPQPAAGRQLPSSVDEPLFLRPKSYILSHDPKPWIRSSGEPGWLDVTLPRGGDDTLSLAHQPPCSARGCQAARGPPSTFHIPHTPC